MRCTVLGEKRRRRLLLPFIEDGLVRQRQRLRADYLAATFVDAVDLVLTLTRGHFEGGVAVETAERVEVPPGSPGEAFYDRAHAAPVIAERLYF